MMDICANYQYCKKERKIMIELSQNDIEIIKNHKQKFLEPILTIAQLSKLDLSDAELLNNDYFKSVVSQLTEIDKQGLRPQFDMFVTICQVLF